VSAVVRGAVNVFLNGERTTSETPAVRGAVNVVLNGERTTSETTVRSLRILR
jgi:hypothetical protein